MFVEFVDDFPGLVFRLVGSKLLVCDGGTKKCAQQHGFKCSSELRLDGERNSVSAWSLKDNLGEFALLPGSSLVNGFVPTHKLSFRKDDEKEHCVLAIYGRCVNCWFLSLFCLLILMKLRSYSPRTFGNAGLGKRVS